jgi:hypothetical protein
VPKTVFGCETVAVDRSLFEKLILTKRSAEKHKTALQMRRQTSRKDCRFILCRHRDWRPEAHDWRAEAAIASLSFESGAHRLYSKLKTHD